MTAARADARHAEKTSRASRRSRVSTHRAQNTRPHARQWWRRSSTVNGREHGLWPHALASLSFTQCVFLNDGWRFASDPADPTARDDREPFLASPGRNRRSAFSGAAEAPGASAGFARARGNASGVSGEAGDDESSSGRVGDPEAWDVPRHVATFAGDGVSRASAWRAVAAVIARARAVRVWALMRFRTRAPAGTPGGRARTSAGRV